MTKNAKKTEKEHTQECILIICAHSDDQIFGPGGTIAKYAKEGKKVFTIIFSYGEMTHPYYKKELAITTRVKESQDVDKFIGGQGAIFLGIEENKFMEQFKEKKMYPKLKRIILQHKPTRIFTHSLDDPHPDHRATNKLLLETLDRMKYKCDVYMFDVWTFLNFKKQHYPKIVIDITSTFKTKIKALKMFKSQQIALTTLLWSVYLKAWLHGKGNKTKYAEVFYKIR
jgi:LmbE family N-acetylglucosaminyl deacetylase